MKKKVMKFGIVLVVLAMVTNGAFGAAIWWDNDSYDNSWGTAANWNEGDFVDELVPEVPAVPGYMDDGPDLTPGTGDEFWVPEVPAVPAYTIPGYGNDILPVLGQDVTISNIATTTTNVGQAGPITVDITGAASSGLLYIGKSSATSDAVTVNVDGVGSLTTLGHLRMGEVDGDVSVLNLNSGTLAVTDPDNSRHLIIGYGRDDPALGGNESAADSGGHATFNQAAGTSLVVDADIEVTYFAGATGIGTVAGDITVGDDFRVAGNNHQAEGTSVGTWTMNGDARPIDPGATLILADLEGPGMISHIWATATTK